MIIDVEIKNFRSFESLKIDFRKKKGVPKRKIFIYGENGSGKSNVVSIFNFFKNLIVSLGFQNEVEKLSNSDSEVTIEDFNKFKETYVPAMLKRHKKIGSKENMVISFSFIANDKKGKYRLETTENTIVKEELFYAVEKNITKIYSIDEDIYFNTKLFLNTKYYNDFIDEVYKYKGKHTVLSVLLNEIDKNNEDYMNDSVDKSFLDLFQYFMDMCVRYKRGNIGEESHYTSSNLKLALTEDTVSIDKISDLDKLERVLNEFFTSVYSDIKKVFYKKKNINENEINYELFFRKLLFGKQIDIPYSYESTGTMKLLDVFPFLIEAINGHVVIIDELDSGIHDILVLEVLMNTLESIKGQIIVTTHNTLILNELDPSSIYVINIDMNGYKEILPITQYSDRIQNNHNVQLKYLSGSYYGIPNVGYLDMEHIASIACKDKDFEEEITKLS